MSFGNIATAALFGISAICAASISGAETLTFDDILGGGDPQLSYSEDGYVMTPLSAPGVFLSDEPFVHLDIALGPNASSVGISLETGSAFDAVQFDTVSLSAGLWLDDQPYYYDDVRVRGYQDGVLVAEDSFSSVLDPSLYIFGADFADITYLTIEGVLPAYNPDLFVGGDVHFGFDNLVLIAAVPVPAGLPLMGGGLLFLVVMGRRRRSVAGLPEKAAL
ncbi:hypothetical protein [Actibacterium sp. D379-3]